MNSKRLHLLFGPLMFELVFNKELEVVASFLRQWFKVGLIADEKREPDAVIWCMSREELKGVKDKEKGFTLRCGIAWEIYFVRDAQGRLRVYCTPQLSRRLRLIQFLQCTPLAFLVPFQNKEFATLANLQAGHFVYDIFVPLSQYLLLKKKASFIHAGVLQGPKGGVVFCGRGGSGKTTATTYLYMKHPEKWSFLSDDMGILDEQGKLYPNPMALNIYPYNTFLFPELESFVHHSMSFLEKFNWRIRSRLKGPKGAMKRIASPQNHIGQGVTLVQTIFHLERCSGESPSVKELSGEKFATLEKNILMYELENKLALFTQTNLSADESTDIPAVDEIGAHVARLYHQAIQGKKVYLVHVPKHWDPHTLGEFFVDMLRKLDAGQSIIYTP